MKLGANGCPLVLEVNPTLGFLVNDGMERGVEPLGSEVTEEQTHMYGGRRLRGKYRMMVGKY